jgi:hypothetical protein
MSSVFLKWQDFESESMNEKDLLQFALSLWKDGNIKIEQRMQDEKKIVRYSIKVYEEEND